jgi:tetratricopeptide (TPR) repeat protein
MADIRLQDYLAKIQDLITGERHDEAISHCQQILRQYPKHVATYCLLGEACLEMGRHKEATDLFQRTLSADPENLMARVGLGIIYAVAGAQSEAIWQMERAYELAPGNPEVRRELEHFYVGRNGEEKPRLQLTRGGLGRLYARNGLYERAIAEFRSILSENPDSVDIRASLSEALWREGRRLEAVEACLDLVQVLPNCLKANLILGEIWVRGGHEDAGQEKLQVARALDPENLVAQEVMGSESPLPLEDVYILEWEFAPKVEEAPPAESDTDVDAGIAATAALAEVVGETDDHFAADELPDWLLELPTEEARAGAEMVAVPEEGPAFLEDVPEWLVVLAATASEERPVVPEPVLDEGLLSEGVAPSPAIAASVETMSRIEGYPDWLHGLDEPAATDGPPVSVETAEAGIQLSDGEALADGVAAEEVPDWVRDIESAADDESPSEDRPSVEERPSDEDRLSAEDLLTTAAAPVAAVAASKEAAPPGEELPPWVRTMEAAVADVAIDEGAKPDDETEQAAASTAEYEVETSPHDDEEIEGPDVPVETTIEAEANESEGAEPPLGEEAADAPTRLEALQEQIAAQPDNYRARMELARRYRDEKDWNASLAEYEELVSTRRLLPAVIEDLKSMTEEEDVDPVQLYKLMGDAYTQADQPDEAQEMYSRARRVLGKE